MSGMSDISMKKIRSTSSTTGILGGYNLGRDLVCIRGLMNIKYSENFSKINKFTKNIFTSCLLQ